MGYIFKVQGEEVVSRKKLMGLNFSMENLQKFIARDKVLIFLLDQEMFLWVLGLWAE
jgi:hypothetical protein